jgi:hypothetical protein
MPGLTEPPEPPKLRGQTPVTTTGKCERVWRPWNLSMAPVAPSAIGWRLYVLNQTRASGLGFGRQSTGLRGADAPIACCTGAAKMGGAKCQAEARRDLGSRRLNTCMGKCTAVMCLCVCKARPISTRLGNHGRRRDGDSQCFSFLLLVAPLPLPPRTRTPIRAAPVLPTRRPLPKPPTPMSGAHRTEAPARR